MTPEQLKASILQMAIQGKLVEQRAEEGDAEELYQQIQAEKQKLIKEGKIKKEKPLPEISESEIPFDIPESWKWVRMGEIGDTNIGLTYKPSDKANDGIIVLRSSNIQNGKMDYVDIVRVSCPIPERATISRGDLLICARNGSRSLVGKAAIVDKEGMAFGAFMAKFCSPINDYLLYFLQSPIFRGQLDGVKTETINQITQDMLRNQLLPLPPLEEQHRIVAKIEELLPYVDRYAKSWNELEQLNAMFPEDMKKSILQYAIQGRLVEQRPEEGDAEELYQQIQAEKQKLIDDGKIKKEKPLPEITESEIPFDIPESWKWCHLSEVIDVRDGTHDSPKYVTEGIPLVTSKNLSDGKIDYGNVKYITQADADKINERSAVGDNDILFAMIGSIGNPVLVKKDREFCIKNMALFKKYADTSIDMKFMYCFFVYAQYALKAEASGGVQSFISLKRFREYPFPLPPLAEQHRIVAKIEELLPYCDRLAKN
jgi:type I restriction enzyme S subunit